MEKLTYNTDPTKQYEGPDFDEYCISEAKYLSANRDRTPCVTCPLNNLCIAGFEEQVKKIQNGENPSLTEGCSIEHERLLTENLFNGLTEEQIMFLKRHVPNLK